MTQLKQGAISGDELRNQLDEQVQELHHQLREKDRVLENYKRARGKQEILIQRITNNIAPVTPLPAQYQPEKRRTKKKVIACMQASDMHMGAVQNADEIEGLNEFNPLICYRRCMGFSDSALRYIQTLRHAYTINELHWFDTGDNTSGDIHRDLIVTNAFPSPVQVVEAARVKAFQISYLAPFFERIIVHFISADNHSRLTKKPQAAEAGVNSLNYLVGVMLEQYMEKHDNVEVRVYPVTEKVIRVANYNYLALHGHTVLGWMGVPWYGLERKVGKESTSRLAAIMRQQNEKVLEMARKIGFHKMLHGHFHVKFNGELMRCSASVQGTTTLDHEHGRFSEPSQPCWLIHPEHGEFADTNFQLRSFDHVTAFDPASGPLYTG